MNIDIKALAEAPREKRIQAINDRLRIMMTQSETERFETMKGLVMAVSQLPDAQKTQVIADRTLCISQLPANQLTTLMKTRADLSSQIPRGVNETDMKLTLMALRQWPESKREPLIDQIKKVYTAAKIPMPDIDRLNE
jgi:hypothetical protein